MSNRNNPLCVDIVDHELRISIGIDTLAWAAENEPEHGLWGDGRMVVVTDKPQWAVDVRRALMKEDHDGTTPVDLLLDGAARDAFDDGSAAAECGSSSGYTAKRRRGPSIP